MQSLLTVIALVLALADGFVAGIRYQRDGVILDTSAAMAPAPTPIDAPPCTGFSCLGMPSYF